MTLTNPSKKPRPITLAVSALALAAPFGCSKSEVAAGEGTGGIAVGGSGVEVSGTGGTLGFTPVFSV